MVNRKSVIITTFIVLIYGLMVGAQEASVPVEMVFIDDLELGIPAQDVYYEVDAVMRPQGDLTDDMLDLPAFGVLFDNPPDIFEEPFDVGPYPMGAPLGFTLGEWFAATGTGTYTVMDDMATLDLSFTHLVPDGIYTLRCVEFNLIELTIDHVPCGEPDGSTNQFQADADGNGEIVVTLTPFPPSTDEFLYEVALGYHSDGQTFGADIGDFGRNFHVQLVYDFLPPDEGTEPQMPIEMVFIDDLELGIPAQDVYYEVDAVMRPQGDLTDDMLDLPAFGVLFDNPPDIFEEPFDVGPYPMGVPLGFTLGEWFAATGTGTYTVTDDMATLDLSFTHLVPDGIYTLRCVEFNLIELTIDHVPCGEPDGSTNQFQADADGNGEIVVTLTPFPPSTDEFLYEVALGYHSDGQTFGADIGDFGRNFHVQLVYDFLPPEAD